MTRRKRTLLAVGMLAMALVPLVLFWFSQSPHHITTNNIGKLKIGMTAHDVERLLGAPPGDFGRGAITSIASGSNSTGGLSVFWPGHGFPHEWTADDVAVQVKFDQDGRAESITEVSITREGVIDRLRRHIGFPRSPVLLRPLPDDP